MAFPGFPAENRNPIPIPEPFFQQLLRKIDDLDELRLTLFLFWRFEKMEGSFRYLLASRLNEEYQDFVGRRKAAARSGARFDTALQKAVDRGTLLVVNVDLETGSDRLVCLNSPRGRALVEAVRSGHWEPQGDLAETGGISVTPPNIFQLYEANIGPLTPMIADALRDAEKTYPPDWINEAIHIAVERNKRSWNYIEAILHRWQEGGRDDRKEKQDRRDSEEARRRYLDWEK